MSSRTTHRVIPPPLYFLACLLAGSALHYAWPARMSPWSFAAGLIAGCAILAAAFGIAFPAFMAMRRRRTPVEPWATPVHLVTDGPFRFTRNPLYVGLISVLTAIAVMVNSLWLLAAALMLLLLLDRLVVRREEALLAELFGKAYEDYRARVRRWL